MENNKDLVGDLVLAKVAEAAHQRRLSQIRLAVEVNGKNKFVRVIVIPEELDQEFPNGIPMEKKG